MGYWLQIRGKEIMRRNLAFKLILCFTLMFLGSLFLLNTVGTHYLYDKVVEKEKDHLYDQASSLSDQYLTNFYSSTFSLDSLKEQFYAIDHCIDSHIWLISNSGMILCNSQINTKDMDSINITQYILFLSRYYTLL